MYAHAFHGRNTTNTYSVSVQTTKCYFSVQGEREGYCQMHNVDCGMKCNVLGGLCVGWPMCWAMCWVAYVLGYVLNYVSNREVSRVGCCALEHVERGLSNA